MSQRRSDWHGVYVVSVTPFTRDGAVDQAAFDSVLDTFVADGVHGIVVAGSTGEWYTLHDDERIDLFERAKARVGGRVKLIAGTSAIGTADAVALTRRAMDIGFDGAMVLAPPYALPNQRELLAHFAALADVGLPLMVYNNPGRTQVNLTAPMLEQIARAPTVVALKESSKDLYQIAQTVRALGDELAVFSGLEPYALPTLARGAVGVVSMAVNFAGHRAVQLWEHAAAGRQVEARKAEAMMDTLYDAFYAGGYGAYVVIKECMNIVGRPGGWPRRPHLRPDDAGRAELTRVLGDLGLLPAQG